MKRWLALGCGLLVFVASLASCNTFDDPGTGLNVAVPPSDFGGSFGPIVAGAPSFGPAGSGGFPFGSGGSGGFLPFAAGSGGGGWQLLDAGPPPSTPATDDSGADDAG